MKWYDTGNEESYEETKVIFPNNLAIEKDNEAKKNLQNYLKHAKNPKDKSIIESYLN